MRLIYCSLNNVIDFRVNPPYFCHLKWSMGRTLCYVNKEYNLGILKWIILFLKCLQSFQFTISYEKKGLHTVCHNLL